LFGNLPALFNKCGLLLFSFLLLLGGSAGPQEADLSGEPDSGLSEDINAEGLEPGEFDGEVPETAEDWSAGAPERPRWFRSNAAGMFLEELPSRVAALRNEYALVIDFFSPEDLPENLVPFYESSYRIEAHILYKNGGEYRWQWIFRDRSGKARLIAVFNPEQSDASDDEAALEAAVPEEADAVVPEADPDEVEETEELAETNEETPTGPAPSGFIELYSPEGWITAEHLFYEEGEEDITGFFYHGGRLVRAEIKRKTHDGEGEKITPLYTDFYRYNRAASLRAIERIYHEGAADADSPVRVSFPHMILNAAADKDFISPGLSYGSEFLENVRVGDGYRVLYTTDERGRILTETRQDDQGLIIGEQINIWSGDRLASVTLKIADDEWRTEYTYDGDGNRLSEQNYRNGTLERVVRTEGDREIEELYMNGAVILRAVWEKGRKISEERVRPKQ
jgi:YD repeat-containing protein